MAAVLSLSLHCIALTVLLAGGGGGHASTAARPWAGARVGADVSTLLLATEAAPSLRDAASLTQLPPPVLDRQALKPIEAPTSEMLPQVELPGTDGDGAGATTSGPDPAEAVPTLLFIRRMGELTSRIQRAWSMPRGMPVADFHCRVQIRQDEGGAIQEVELQSCDSDGRLRESLLQAINGAAPLPKLSDRPQESDSVILNFTAFATASGGRRTVVEPGAAASP